MPSCPKAIYDVSRKQDQQYYAVVKKSNAAIQKARYSLSLQQQRVLCYLITQLEETDTPETVKIFDIKAFYDFMESGNKDYDKVRQALKALKDKSWWITDENGTDILLSFLNTVRADKQSGKVRIKFHEDMLPYLLNLKSCFTKYKLWYTMTMRSEYSLRLYELLKSVEKKESWYFSVDYLKKNFMCEHYKQFNDFKKRVLEPAVTEINEKTDINVTYMLFKDGKTYAGIEFYIEEKDVADRLTVDHNIRSELDGQLTLNEKESEEKIRTPEML